MNVLYQSELSMRAQIAQLAVGESYSRSKRLAFDEMNRRDMALELEALRNTVRSGMFRAADQTGYTYTLEAGEWFTRHHDLIITVVVTRTE